MSMMSANTPTAEPNCDKSYHTFSHPSLSPSPIISAQPSSQQPQHQNHHHPQIHHPNLDDEDHIPLKPNTDSFSVYSSPQTRDLSTLQPPSYNGYHSLYVQNQPVNNNHDNGRYPQVQHPQQWIHKSPPLTAREDVPKVNRLRKACDSCSIRKVKCDESGPPCRACAALDVPCTFDRPSRRRGPPNRYSEAIKKRRLDSPISPSSLSHSLPTSPSSTTLHAELICPFSILERLVDVFFKYMYSIYPFPHEPSFRLALKSREDIKNPSFLALLASMIKVLALSYPRQPGLQFFDLGRQYLFLGSKKFAERCHKVAVEARGAGYLDKDLTIYDAVTSYFLGLASVYAFQWNQTRLYFGEALAITKLAGISKFEDSFSQDINHRSLKIPQMAENLGSQCLAEPMPPKDFIKREVSRRVFWVLFVWIRSMQQCSTQFNDLLLPPTHTDPYPPLPLEVDDEYIFVDHIQPQPPELLSQITGINLHTKVYSALMPLFSAEFSNGIGEPSDWNHLKNILEDCLSNVKQINCQGPKYPQPNPLTHVNLSYNQQDHSSAFHSEAPNLSNQDQPEEIGSLKGMQLIIQKANLNVSQILTRSFLVAKYWNLIDAFKSAQEKFEEPPELSDIAVSTAQANIILNERALKYCNDEDDHENIYGGEHDSVTKDLLCIIRSFSVSDDNLYGRSFLRNICLIISNIIEIPDLHKGSLALKVEIDLGRLLNILTRLQRLDLGPYTIEGRAKNVEDTLRCWEEIKKFQIAFDLNLTEAS